MTDLYAEAVNSRPGKLIASKLGLPRPATLERQRPGVPPISGPVLVGGAPYGRLGGAIDQVLDEMGAHVLDEKNGVHRARVRTRAGARAQHAAESTRDTPGEETTRDTPGEAESDDNRMEGEPVKALIFDATGIADSAQLVELQRFFHPNVRRVKASGRVIVLGSPPGPPAGRSASERTSSARKATAQRALEGFTRSLGKEVGKGIAVQLLHVAEGGEDQIDSTLRFLLSPKSAYVSGQAIEIGPPVADTPQIDWDHPLAGKRALVTGASRGIGEAIASVLRRDGANLVLLDVPALSAELAKVASRLGAETIELDITDEDAPRQIAQRLGDGIDVVVHNAGVTKDRTIAKMPEERWSSLMEINLSSQERIDDELLTRNLLGENGRIVSVSSMSGIAGNSGQTNYATSKAGVIGMVQALAPELATRHATINAVAPGFIETQMTSKMPIGVREVGRRMNSMSQGGLPVDVAETIAWLASPASTGVNGNVVRVCGQSLLGA